MRWIGFSPKNSVASLRCLGRLPILSWLKRLFTEAGFHDTRVEPIRREGTIDGFDDYWGPIEEGVGQIPQTYHALSENDRRVVREEVHARLAQYEMPDGKMTMAVEMLIGADGNSEPRARSGSIEDIRRRPDDLPMHRRPRELLPQSQP